MKNRFLYLLVLVSCILAPALSCFAQAPTQQASSSQTAAVLTAGQEQRPANFVFLIDVSGSMVSKRTMVPGADGKDQTLFEALREALRQIVDDDRLLTPQSKVAFVTFGTAVTEKSDWPSSLENAENRSSLEQKIRSPEQLEADKHGDTYMAGALDKAFQKASELSAQSEPCTTCFIVMLTDGWDEPPAGASLRVRDVAAKIVQKQTELKKKLGVNTWQVRVVGLQRLPDRKAGTTTAAELASLLGGEFLDVTKQNSGTVAQRIYGALEKTISDLQGRVEVQSPGNGGLADFGLMQGGSKATASIPVVSRSCYGEKIFGTLDVSSRLSESERRQVQRAFDNVRVAGKLKDADSFKTATLADKLPPGALEVRLEREVLLTPTIDQVAQGGTVWQPMDLVARVGKACPPGAYIGAVKVGSTARCDAIIPYAISVPSRIVTDNDELKVKVQKPGFLWTKPTSAEMKFAVATSLAGTQMAPEEVTVEPDNGKTKAGALFEKRLINSGKTSTVKLNLSEKGSQAVSLAVDIPAEQQPGVYDGELHVKLSNSANVIAPAAVHYTLEILPSPWEQVRPIAIPILIVLGVVVLLWIGIWAATQRS